MLIPSILSVTRWSVRPSPQGFDPQTQPIGWGDLELVQKTGRYPYQSHYVADVSTSGYSGRHVVVTVWKASHMDQKYFLCSDVTFN
ncbi:lytic polysaccharide monooxygenase [Streptomyces microflavus]|uniref:lytic polysaccharide monooxygenase n=1 Tax=Streptomyces microflavus TaxID=1919 RepID=UPI00331C797A